MSHFKKEGPLDNISVLTILSARSGSFPTEIIYYILCEPSYKGHSEPELLRSCTTLGSFEIGVDIDPKNKQILHHSPTICFLFDITLKTQESGITCKLLDTINKLTRDSQNYMFAAYEGNTTYRVIKPIWPKVSIIFHTHFLTIPWF